MADSNDHDLAYSLGASLGERLRQDMPGLQLDALVEGLKQSYQGQPLKLDKARMQAVLQQHEAREGDAATQKLQAAETRFMANERGRYGVRELPEGVLYSELQPGTGTQPKRAAKCRYVMWQAAGWLCVRPEPGAPVVQPGLGDRRVAGGLAKDARRGQMAPGNSVGAGLWRARRG